MPVFPYEADIQGAIAASQADTVALTSAGELGSEGVRDLSWQLEKLGIDLVVSPGIVDVAGPRLTVRPVADLPLIHVDKPQYQGAKRFQKRALDVSFSLLALLAASPIMIVAAVAVKVTSRGPVFYRSERIGLDGVPFRMIKFRTMVVDADRRLAEVVDLNDSVGGVLFKVRRDPRVTSGGQGFAPLQHRRTPAVHQCAPWGDERGRTASAAAVRSRDLRPPGAAPAAGPSRHYRTVAGQWPVGPVLGGLSAAGPVLRRELVHAKRFGDRGEDRHGSLPWVGGVLSVGLVDTENRGFGCAAVCVTRTDC